MGVQLGRFNVRYRFQGHVLNEASLRPSQHLQKRMLGREHMVMVRVKFLAVLSDECFVVFNGTVYKKVVM